VRTSKKEDAESNLPKTAALPPAKLPPIRPNDDYTLLKPGDPPPNVPSPHDVASVFRILGALYKTHPLHVDPAEQFQVLVATVLSARTKDPTTNEAMGRLWQRAGADKHEVRPEDILAIPEQELAALLKPVGFWNAKARHLHGLSAMLLERFDGRVPQSREELLELPGVGRKVANLVLNICFAKAAICVDVHVQRVTNRLGWIVSDDPLDTEMKLMELLPEKYWSPTNLVFVNHGQQVCQPIIPRCSQCPIYKYCARVNVMKVR
jgi:endonuclease-3